jgi:hypothetical protein
MTRARDLAKGTFSGDLTVDTNTLFVDSANNNVGIGTSSPTGKLSVSDPTYLSSTATLGSSITLNSENTASWLGARELISFESVGNGADHRTGTLSVKLKKGVSDATLAEYMQINAVSNYTTFSTEATERMRIDSAGRVTMPYQPAFLARPTSIQADIPASTLVTVVFGTEVFDQNTDFASNTFTAPVTGKYQFSYSLYLTNIDTAAAYYEINLQTSNRGYYAVIDPNFASDLNYLTLTGNVLADMDVGDTAYVTIRQQTGTAQTDITQESFFSGYLVA